MKKVIAPLFIVAALVACGGGETKKTTEPTTNNGTEKPTDGEKDLSSNPDYTAGLQLVAKSDCFTCHKVDEPLTGPTYRDVANKYAGLPDTIIGHLADKVIKGVSSGSGVWGEAMMSPHAGIQKADAEKMVKYILLLKNK